MLRPIGFKKAAAALIAGVALSAATIGAAQADPWRHDHWRDHGGGWGGRGGGVYVAPGYYYAPPPPVYYAPPPVYYAPPPVYYAPPPPVYYAPQPAISLQFRL